jgi:hypothetical protein
VVEHASVLGLIWRLIRWRVAQQTCQQAELGMAVSQVESRAQCHRHPVQSVDFGLPAHISCGFVKPGIACKLTSVPARVTALSSLRSMARPKSPSFKVMSWQDGNNDSHTSG